MSCLVARSATLTLYIAMSALNLFAISLRNALLAGVSKTTLMPILWFYLNMSASTTSSSLSATSSVLRCINTGLVFSWLGDVFLIFSRHTVYMFLAGLISFLIAHISYIAAFVKSSTTTLPQAVLHPFTWGTCVQIGVMLYFATPFISTGTGVLEWPIRAYCLALASMLFAAQIRSCSPSSYWCALVGALLFIISDFTLGYLAFQYRGEAKAIGGVVIMGTYVAAQLCIVWGVMMDHCGGKKAME